MVLFSLTFYTALLSKHQAKMIKLLQSQKHTRTNKNRIDFKYDTNCKQSKERHQQVCRTTTLVACNTKFGEKEPVTKRHRMSKIFTDFPLTVSLPRKKLSDFPDQPTLRYFST